MRLTVLGRHGPYPPAGGACSGYLIEPGEGTSRVLVECGNGVLSRLQEYCRIDELTAVVLSHLHPDHVSDLFILRYALAVSLAKGFRQKPLAVYAPQEPIEEFQRLPYKDVFSVRGYVPGEEEEIGGMTFRFIRTRHAIPCCAMSIETGERKLVYSGDTGECEGVIMLANEADLFLCEANLLDRDNGDHPAGHLTGRGAGEMARRAGVKRLVLTHLFPGYDPGEVLGEAAGTFNGIVELAEEGRIYEI